MAGLVSREGKSRHLVLHDYGMGGLWWWVWARSPEEIVESVAEVEVVDLADVPDMAADADHEEVDLGDLPEGVFAELRDQRAAQRGLPGYGVLAGRDRVHLSETDDGCDYLVEFGPDGRRLREVWLRPDGDNFRYDDWPFNPPTDLRDPSLAAREITEAEFEAAWQAARPDPDQ